MHGKMEKNMIKLIKMTRYPYKNGKIDVDIVKMIGRYSKMVKKY